MALRPSLLACALVLALAGCGGGASGSSTPARATPHLAETEVVSAARSGGGDLQLAWAKALRVATAEDLQQLDLDARDRASDPGDWYLVQACSFSGSAHGYWSNPVAHRIVGADEGSASCDANAAWPPPARPTGDDCMDSWNAWIGHAPLNYRAAAAAAKEAFAGRLDGKCIVVLSSDGEGVTLMEGSGGWTVFDSSATPASPNAVVHSDGTLERRA